VSAGPTLESPHHDGSELHVSDPAPALGDVVTVFVRVPRAAGVTRVLVRTTPDGEPAYAEGRVDREEGAETWWRTEVPMANPVVHYRFLLDGPGGYRWLTAAGVVGWDVPDATDFRLVAFDPPPPWVADAIFYQVFPDRFAPSSGLREWPAWALPAAWDDPVALDGEARGTQLYGGDLWGVAQRLDHLEALGVTAVYLNPFFPGRSNHRYDARSFEGVDPLLGGEEALVALSRALHARGMRLVGDLTVNHCGSAHPWFERARSDPGSPEARYFVRDGDGEFVYWLGVRTLPKLDHRNPEVRRHLYEGPGSVAARFLRPPFDLDGWRIDVANMAGRFGDVDVNHLIATALRSTLREVKPEAYLLAEHAHDPSPDLLGDGWHGTMSYAAFTRPLWCWLGDRRRIRASGFLGAPVPLPRLPGPAVARTVDAFRAAVPWRSWVHSLTLLGSHDTARWRTVAGDLAPVGVGVLLTFPGVPCVLYGDEVGLEGVDGEDARKPMPWDPARWDHAALSTYRSLIGLRRRHRALRRGGFRWAHVGDDVLVYLREAPGERILVQAARAPHPPVALPAELVGPGAHLLGGPGLEPRKGQVTLPSDGPAFHAWLLSG
jgi:alpha-glucosidase